MSDEKKPDPVDDLKKGLGLLYRAAKNAVDEIPTGKIEEAVKTGAREVGRAIENVTGVIDEQIFHNKPRSKPPTAPPPAPPENQAAGTGQGGGDAPEHPTEDGRRPQSTDGAPPYIAPPDPPKPE